MAMVNGADESLLESVRYYLAYYKNVDQIAYAISPKILPEVIVDLLLKINTPESLQVIANYYGSFYIGESRFLAIADTHIGGDYEWLPFLNEAYAYAYKNGIKFIINAGDIIEGKSNTLANGKPIETQIQIALDNYPRPNDIKTYYIQGNHDFNTLWGEHVCVRKELEAIPNLICIGSCKSYLNLLGTHPISLNHYIKNYDIAVPGYQTEMDFMGHKHYYIPSEATRQIYIPTLSLDLKDYDEDNLPGFLDITVTDSEYISSLYTFDSKTAKPEYVDTRTLKFK